MPASVRQAQADRYDPTAVDLLVDLLARERPAFHADAACREHPEVSWFPELGEDGRTAKAICAGCLVLGECRSWALEQGPGLVGVFGGLSSRERQQRRRAAA